VVVGIFVLGGVSTVPWLWDVSSPRGSSAGPAGAGGLELGQAIALRPNDEEAWNTRSPLILRGRRGEARGLRGLA